MENRYKEGLRRIYKNARLANRMLIAAAGEEEDVEVAKAIVFMAKAYMVVVGWIVDEIRDADAEEKREGKYND